MDRAKSAFGGAHPAPLAKHEIDPEARISFMNA
jgi:hypothetical protein